MYIRSIFIVLFSIFFCSCGGGGGGESQGGSGSGSSSSSSGSSGGGSSSGGGENETFCVNTGVSADPGGTYTVPDLKEAAPPNHSGMMMKEHMAALALVPYSQATHVAVREGAWCDPDTWHNREIPGDDAHVVIPEGQSVTYGVISPARISTLRIDGELSFSHRKSTLLIVDTIYVDSRGVLEIGTLESPINAADYAKILFADNGDIDTSRDPMLLSRGLISHGKTMIHGARKTAFVELADNPTSGDSTLALAAAPDNWTVGDTLVLTGTRYSGWKWNNSEKRTTYHGTRDEVRKIKSISGKLVELDWPLEHDHLSPRSDLKARVANFTRNVLFASESDEDLPVHQRGHVMFMHNPDADIRYAEFRELGRTDKSVANFDIQDIEKVTPDSNTRGRYSFHFHRTGTEDKRRPAIAVGNAVFGAPGWGYTHHDSHAYFYGNVSFDTFGAGFVAETGNETGAWVDNLAIKAEGANDAFNPKNGNDFPNFDIARTGDGFWFQGRMVRSVGNVAASVNHGFVYLHRGRDMLDFPAESFMLPEAIGYGEDAHSDEVPIRNFHNNEAFASTVGLFIVKADPEQGHDIYTQLTDFTAWEVRAGAAIEYTAHYLLENFDLVGSTPEPFMDAQFGIQFGTNTSDTVVMGGTIESFPEGIRLEKRHTLEEDQGLDQYVVVGVEYIGVETELVDYDPEQDRVLELKDVLPGRFSIELDNNMQFELLKRDQNLTYKGSKTDSVGNIPLPAGSDDLGISLLNMIALVEREGYYRAENGDAYAVVEQYFSDRGTAELHKYGFKTYLGEEVDAAMQDPDSNWGKAQYRGLIDLESAAPLARDDSVQTPPGVPVRIDLVVNDMDPDGDPVSIDGIVQPTHGVVFSEGDDAVSYHPDIGFSGSDKFKYWATDGQGNFSPAWVEVDVN